MSNSNQLKAGAIISYIQMGLSVIVGLLFTPVMIKLLGQSEYGLYNTVASTISMLSILRLGFNNSYIRYYAKYKKSNDNNLIFKLNGVFFGLFIVIGLISFVCGIFLTFNLEMVFSSGLTVGEYKIARILMVFLTANLAISFPMSVFSNIISANEKFVFLKSLDIVKTVIGPMVSLPLLLVGYGSIGMVAITLAVSLLVDGCYIYYVLVKLNNRFVFDLPEKGILQDLGVYTSFIALELIVDQINWNIDKMLLARFKGTAIVAIYSVGYSLYTYYQSFSASISGVFTPRIHRLINTVNDKTEQRVALTQLFTKVGRIQFIVLSLLCSGILFFGRFFITRIWASEQYEDAYYVALLLIFPATIALIQNLGIEIQRAEYKHQFRSIVYSIMAVINLGLSIVLCQIYGAVGSAIGTAISLIIANGIIMNIYYHKKCNINIVFFWKSVGRLAKGLIIPYALGILLYMFLPPESITFYLCEIIIYTVVYAISMWFIGMDSFEKGLVYQILKKIRIQK